MNVPEELRYSSDHEWVRVEGDKVRVGVTDFAQDNLGDVVFFDVPEVGLEVELGSAFSEIESTKSVSDIFAPLTGVVVEVNEALQDSPELVNGDPYGEGWLVVIEPADVSAVASLMDAAAYTAMISE